MHSLSYTTSGDGGHPAVLFLHGFMGSSDDWRDAIARLDDRYHCIAADLPGHGDSLGLPEEGYTMDGSANAILRLLDGLEIRRASIVGYSMGGRLALYLALRHPGRCERLFLESTSPGLDSGEERAARRESDEEKAERLGSGVDFGEFLEEWHRQPLFSSLSRHGGLVESLVEKRRRNDPRELAKSLRGMGAGIQPSLREGMSNLRVPTLALAGGLDGKFAGTAREMAERSPRVSPKIVPHAGHNIHIEAPKEYAGLLGEFLSPAP